MIKFLKLHTCGNDFIIFFKKIKKKFKKINKKPGLSCDQILNIINLNYKKKFIKIKIFNNNFTEANNCGNGIRCLSWFFFLKLKKKFLYFFLNNNNIIVSFKKNKKNFIIYNIPKKKIKILFRIKYLFLKSFYINLINIHVIFLINNIKSKKIYFIINNVINNFGDIYNIEFIQIIKKSYLYIRIFEKNVGETYSCGSGITSVVCFLKMYNFVSNNVFINSIGGNCNIKINKKYIIIYGKQYYIANGYV
ncbi:MAG: hypothetical protein ACH6QP_00010 [Candidatus Carsonella ruddii]